jgi:hypothetical protein
MIASKESAALSACLETAPSIAPSLPTTDARAARLAKFRREQLIVDYLNRGVSIAEIAARVGLSEKRMRAVIKEILAHRCPHPPEEFLAIQVSRLNEALLVAASAMSGANLKAVDRVVKIVSELDRYHGFAAFVGRRRPEPRLDAPAEGATTYGAALVCQARFAPGDDEEIEFERNTQFPLAPHQRGEGWGEGLGRLATVGARPQIPPQAFERVDSAPGLATSPETSDLAAQSSLLRDATHCVAPRYEGGEVQSAAAAADDNRPQNPAQGLEKVESAPGIATSPPAEDALAPAHNRPEIPAQDLEKVGSAPGIATSPEATPPDLVLSWPPAGPTRCARKSSPPLGDGNFRVSPSKDAPESAKVASSSSWLRDAPPFIVPQHEGGEVPVAASPGDTRPENPAQGLEKVESVPGHSWLAQAASASERAIVSPVPNPGGFRFRPVRMTLNRVMTR